MLEILQFIFSSFWVWLGFAILLLIIVEGIPDMIRAIRGK